MDHTFQDEVSLEIARRVAARLAASPEPLTVALDNLNRWSQQNATAPALLRCYAEWREILAQPFEQVCARLCEKSDAGQRLRQNSPFAGVLPAAEVWEIKRHLRHAAIPA
ncbi:MAG: hypothetical protein ABMA26_04045 [Limisphaerales bacterium]